MALDFSPNSPFGAAMAKQTFSEETGIELGRFILAHKGIELEDDRKLLVVDLQYSHFYKEASLTPQRGLEFICGTGPAHGPKAGGARNIRHRGRQYHCVAYRA